VSDAFERRARRSHHRSRDGPILLQDHYLIEQMAMANFNRERIPERQPHAKGGGAFGRFEVTGTSAATPRRPCSSRARRPTPCALLLVAGERGSPDTWRDPRGFALKFYTTEGNYDMVGNNTPVFFIRDPMKFQHFIRSQKRRADTNLRDHDMQWDFWTLSPESAHQVTWLMGDRGIPKTWRHMNGYSSHTYMWVNAKGEKFWVKYHFKTDQGIEFLTQEEADRLAGVDGDYHTRDLFEAIARGDHPSWTLHVQIMPFAEAETYRFNPFDLTKVWPHGDYPLTEVGKLTLDRNPTDYHTEIEQAAFEPNNLVPGIGPSPDKMLLGRLFSYADAHRARMGVNYKQIPVNRPQSPCTATARTARCASRTSPTRSTRPTPRVAPRRRQALPAGGHLGSQRRVRARGLHAAQGRRRLRPGRHAGARGDGRRARARTPPGWCPCSTSSATSRRRSGAAEPRQAAGPSLLQRRGIRQS
jgi:catalase